MPKTTTGDYDKAALEQIKARLDDFKMEVDHIIHAMQGLSLEKITIGAETEMRDALTGFAAWCLQGRRAVWKAKLPDPPGPDSSTAAPKNGVLPQKKAKRTARNRGSG